MIWRARTLPTPGMRLEQADDLHLADDLVALALGDDVGERALRVLEPVLDLGPLPAGGGGLLERLARCSGVSGGRATVGLLGGTVWFVRWHRGGSGRGMSGWTEPSESSRGLATRG